MSGPDNQDGRAQPWAQVYALGSSPAERERLRRLSEELRVPSAEGLDRVGAGRGWSAIIRTERFRRAR